MNKDEQKRITDQIADLHGRAARMISAGAPNEEVLDVALDAFIGIGLIETADIAETIEQETKQTMDESSRMVLAVAYAKGAKQALDMAVDQGLVDESAIVTRMKIIEKLASH